jgi:hypothetical protein
MPTKFLFALLLAIFSFPAFAEESSWFAYLYNGNSKELVRVNLDGTHESQNLGLDENTFTGGFDMTFSADGSRLAFCAITFPTMRSDTQTPPAARLYMRDLAAQTNLLELDLGEAAGCRTGQEAFSPDGSLLAVALTSQFPGNALAESSGSGWRLVVLETETGSIVHELTSQSPEATNVQNSSYGPTLSYVRSIDDTQVIFAQVPYGVSGVSEVPAYRWQFDPSTVEALTSARWSQFRVDTLDSTSESVWVAADASLPAAIPSGPVPPYNVVKLEDSEGEVSTIYHNPELTVVDARFINHGQQLAIQLMSPSDFEQNAEVTYQWVALDRTGSTTELLTEVTYSTLAAAPEGYLLLRLTSEGTDVVTFQSHLDYAILGGETTELWASESSPGESWEIAWAAPTEAADDLLPFLIIAS